MLLCEDVERNLAKNGVNASKVKERINVGIEFSVGKQKFLLTFYKYNTKGHENSFWEDIAEQIRRFDSSGIYNL